MLVAKDCAFPSKNRPDHQPMASGLSFDLHTSPWIDSFSVNGSGYLRDHRVDGKIIYPAAGFSMSGIAVHQILFGVEAEQQPIVLENLKFRHTLALPGKNPIVLGLSYQPEQREFGVHAISHTEPSNTRQLATGNLSASGSTMSDTRAALDELLERCSKVVDVEDFYHRLGQSGLEYGSFFKRIVGARVSRHTDEAITQLTRHPLLFTHNNHWASSITLLDSAFQSLAVALDTDKNHLYMPSRIRTLTACAEVEQDLWCYTRITKSTNRAVVGDISLFSVQGDPLIEIQGLLCMKIPRAGIEQCGRFSGTKNQAVLRKDNPHHLTSSLVHGD